MPSFNTVAAFVLTLAGLYSPVAAFRMAERRGCTLKQFGLDSLFVLLGFATGALLTYVVLFSVVRPQWGQEGILLVPLTMLLFGGIPLLGGLYLGERVSASTAVCFRLGRAILALISSTLTSLLFAFVVWVASARWGHGSFVGEQLGFMTMVCLTPLLWIGLIVGFYTSSVEPAASRPRRAGGGVAQLTGGPGARRTVTKVRTQSVLTTFFVLCAASGLLVIAYGSDRKHDRLSQDTDPRYVVMASPPNRQLSLVQDQPQVVEEFDLEIVLKGCGEEQGRKHVDLDLNYSGRDHHDWERHTADDNRTRATPMVYPDLQGADLLRHAKVVYRTHRRCTGQIEKIWKDGKETLDLSGYQNFVCRSRFYEQCIVDGTFDSFDEEHCDFGVIRLHQDEETRATDFAVRLRSAGTASAVVDVSYIGRGRYSPSGGTGAPDLIR